MPLSGKFILLIMIVFLSMTACSENGIDLTGIGEPANEPAGAVQGNIGGGAGSSDVPQGETRAVVSISEILIPSTGNVYIYQDGVTIDTSNVNNGYVKVRYTGNAARIAAQLIIHNITYIFEIDPNGRWEILPLAQGNGVYTLNVLENIEGSIFALIISTDFTVQLNNPFLPFLYPNQFVNFNQNSRAVALAAQLAEGAVGELDVVSNIYHYIINNIEYDFEKAVAIAEGRITSYIPDIDATLASGRGICFDYASLMTAMLRAQLIPTRLVIGYVSGGIYHAWIEVYTQEYGWVGAAQFRGPEQIWTLMDPTFSAGQAADLAAFIGDATNYEPVFLY